MAKIKKEYDKRIFRLLFILNKLDSGGKVSTYELAEEFNVSVRSVQRDIDLLQSTGFLLAAPTRGAYEFEEGFSLKKMKLTREEASVLSLINETLRSFGDPFKKTFSSILKKVVQQEFTSPYYAKIPKSDGLKSCPFTAGIEKAIGLSQKITIGYDAGGRAKEYRLLPLKIVFYEGFWYLLAKTDSAEKSAGLRKFRLEKIKSFRRRDEYFEEPANLKAMLDRSVNAWFSSEKPRDVVLRVDSGAAEFFKGHSHLPFQKVMKENKDGSLIIQAKASHNMEIIPTVLKWMPHVTVIGPAALKAQVKALVEEYLRKA